MRNSYTSYLSSVDDDILVSQIKSVLGYAAAYDTVNTGLMGQVAYMNN